MFLRHELTRAYALLIAPQQRSRLLLWVLVLLLAIPKLWLSANESNMSIDGGFYLDVAQHVRDGHGIVTNVSLYHKGFTYFPHPSSIYPLWPLVLGYLARLFPLRPLAVWLPTLLYFASLVIGYAWARRCWGVPLLPRFGFDAGHLFVLLLGLHGAYFRFSSRPYTEALTMTLLLAFLWRAHRRLSKPSFAGGLELGCWIGVLFLARAQMAIAAIAMMLTLAIAVVCSRCRRRYAMMALATVGAGAVTLAPWLLYLSTFVAEVSPETIMRFEISRPNTLLSYFPVYVETFGLFEFILDRAKGLPIAFGLGRSAYYQTFHAFIFALPVAAIVAAFELRGIARTKIASAWRRLHDGTGIPALFLGLFALGAFASLHSIHMTYFSEWYFAKRHALVVVFLVFGALAYLMGHGRRVVRIVGAALFVLGAAGGCGSAFAQAAHKARVSRQASVQTPRLALIEWLKAEQQRRQSLTVAIDRQEAQRLAWRTPGINYHWIHYTTELSDLVTIVEHLGIDYVILGKRRWVTVPGGSRIEVKSRFESAKGFQELLSEMPMNLQRYRIYTPR